MIKKFRRLNGFVNVIRTLIATEDRINYNLFNNLFLKHKTTKIKYPNGIPDGLNKVLCKNVLNLSPILKFQC